MPRRISLYVSLEIVTLHICLTPEQRADITHEIDKQTLSRQRQKMHKKQRDYKNNVTEVQRIEAGENRQNDHPHY